MKRNLLIVYAAALFPQLASAFIPYCWETMAVRHPQTFEVEKILSAHGIRASDLQFNVIRRFKDDFFVSLRLKTPSKISGTEIAFMEFVKSWEYSFWYPANIRILSHALFKCSSCTLQTRQNRSTF